MRKIFVTCVIGLCTAFGAAAQDVHVVLTVSGGEAEYRDQFIDWGKRLIAALEKQADADPARIHWLAERANGQPAQAGDVSLESIEPMITKAADQLGEADDLYIYIIGHGSAYSRESKFHIPGPDVSAEDFAGYLEGVSARRIVILNETPSSAGWINVLSGPNRVM